ncbi:MAG TPA: hypothetical protein VK607_10630 [Kofleriaceae bacterium]|nr:hypothetical protein [Kofleriaceae bacterium]
MKIQLGNLARDVHVPRGWKLCIEGASDMTPCGCVRSRNRAGIGAVPIVWRSWAGRYWMRCGACGAKWSRAVPAYAKPGCLDLNGAHPEERAARAERTAKAVELAQAEMVRVQRLRLIRKLALARRARS